MRPLSAAGVLDLADRLVGGASPEDALAMLAAVYPETSREDVAAWPLGLRDARLLEIRRRTVPGPLEIDAACPTCGDEVEVGLDVEEIVRAGNPPNPSSTVGGDLCVDPGPPLHLVLDDLTVRFRRVTTEDLLAVRKESTAEDATWVLLDRVVAEARRGETEITARELTDEEIQALSDRLVEADPAAEIRLALTCPGCESSWTATFDPASFVREELRRLAGRILAEVHVLASAYGWREQEILAMSGRRRRAYLNLLGA